MVIFGNFGLLTPGAQKHKGLRERSFLCYAQVTPGNSDYSIEFDLQAVFYEYSSGIKKSQKKHFGFWPSIGKNFGGKRALILGLRPRMMINIYLLESV